MNDTEGEEGRVGAWVAMEPRDTSGDKGARMGVGEELGTITRSSREGCS